MTGNNYLVWDVSPNIISTGTVRLPFAISIAGLILTVIIFYLGSNYLLKQRLKKSGKNTEDTISLPLNWIVGLAVVSLCIGQLLTIPINLWIVHSIGPITIRWYGVIFAVAFLSGRFIEVKMFRDAGKPAWAIIFKRDDMFPRHPTMLYESITYIIGFFILWKIYKRYKASPPEGLLTGVFLVYVFTCRFLLEFTKTRQADFTIFAGANIIRGNYPEGKGITHVNILRTIESMYNLARSGYQQINALRYGISDDFIITDIFR